VRPKVPKAVLTPSTNTTSYAYDIFHPAVNMMLPETLWPIYGISVQTFSSSKSCGNFLSILQKNAEASWILNIKTAVEPGHLFIFVRR
jgi:hypothetical protein